MLFGVCFFVVSVQVMSVCSIPLVFSDTPCMECMDSHCCACTASALFESLSKQNHSTPQ